MDRCSLARDITPECDGAVSTRSGQGLARSDRKREHSTGVVVLLDMPEGS